MGRKTIQTSTEKTDYAQAIHERGTAEKIGESVGESSQNSDGTREQTTKGNRDLNNTSVRDLNSKMVKESTMLEQANVGFEVQFKIKITGKIPSLPEFNHGGC